MPDDKETPVEPVAPVPDEAQAEQAAPAEEGATPPATAADKGEELIAGKFKSEEELDKATKSLEEKVTDYQALQSSFTKGRQAMAAPSEQAPEQATAPQTPQPQLDPDSDVAVRSAAREEFERLKSMEFERKNKDKLKDPILAGTVRRLISDANLQGQYLDPDEALGQAEKMLDERIKPQIKQAQTEGVEQGEDIAKKKGQLGAVGEPGKRPEVNPDELGSKEFKKYHGLEYSE